MDGNWAPARVRRNFRIDLTSAILGGAYISVVVTFMPIVVRRMGGSPSDVALVVAAPFIGHLLSPLFTFLFAGVRPVRVTAGTATASRVVFLAGVLVAATPLMLAMTTSLSARGGQSNRSRKACGPTGGIVDCSWRRRCSGRGTS